MSDTPKRKRRWLQFSLRSLLVFTVLCALAAAWLGRKIERKRQEQVIVEEIWKQGGFVCWDSVDGVPSGPAWLRSLFGENIFCSVYRVDCVENMGDDILPGIGDLTRLKELNLAYSSVTDGGLKNLKGLTQLRMLRLDHTAVSNVGLKNLNGMTQLEFLYLDETRVTDEGVMELKAVLPSCEIGH